MVIRFPLRSRLLTKPLNRLKPHAPGLDRTDARRLNRREIEHRERMLEHLQVLERRTS